MRVNGRMTSSVGKEWRIGLMDRFMKGNILTELNMGWDNIHGKMGAILLDNGS